MKTRTTIAVVLAVGMLLVLGGATRSATISINHIGGAGANGTLAATEYAGVVAAANWNNLASYPAGGATVVYGPSALLFGDGVCLGRGQRSVSVSVPCHAPFAELIAHLGAFVALGARVDSGISRPVV